MRPASKISDDVKNAHPEIAWRDIVGTRVILAHAYFQIDPTIVRRVITHDLPVLRAQLARILEDLQDNT